MRFYAVALLAMCLLLVACHSDVTYRYVVNPNGSVTVSSVENMDAQMYQMATSQASPGSDPFGVNTAQAQGWTVSRVVNDDGSHVITLSRTFSRSEAPDLNAVKAPGSEGQNFPITWSHSSTSGFFTNVETYHATFSFPTPTPGPQTSQEDAQTQAMAMNMMSSVVGLHLELKTPGKVVSTNGETTTDGYVRWDLSFAHPTEMDYTVQEPNLVGIGIATGAGIIILAIFIVVLFRRRPAAA